MCSHTKLVLQADPLEAFMAEINQTNQSEAAAAPAEKKAHLELDEDADHVADFLEVCPNPNPNPNPSLSCWRHESCVAVAVAATMQHQCIMCRGLALFDVVECNRHADRGALSGLPLLLPQTGTTPTKKSTLQQQLLMMELRLSMT